MSDCLTCAKSVEGKEQSFEIESNKEIKNALCKHFWFEESQYLKRFICCPCWTKVEDFHRFYCEVEELHSKTIFPPVQLVEIKQEDIQQHDFAPEEQDVLMEAETDRKDSSEDDDNCRAEKNASRSDIGETSKRPRLQKNPLDAVQQYISQKIHLDCDSCAQRCETFEALQRHSMMEHAKKATIVCCSLKFTNNPRFVDHIRLHLDPHQFECSQCSKRFGNGEALKRHVRSIHAAEPGDAMKDEHEDDGRATRRQVRTAAKPVERIGDKQKDEPSVTKNEDTDEKESDDEASDDELDDDDDDYEQESDDSEGSNNSGEDDNDSEESEQDTTTRATVSEDEVAQIQEYVSKNITLECDSCSERPTTFKELQKHSMEEHGKRATILCCNRKLLNSYRFDDHIRYHLNPDRFKCTECSRKCPNREALSRHMQTVHTPEEDKIYSCEECHKKFSTKDSLAKHGRIHGDPAPKPAGKRRLRRKDVDSEKLIAEHINLECDSCHKKCSTFLALQKHSTAEHKRRAYVFCCGLKFNRKPRLIDHVLFHLDPNRFQCKVCHKNFRQTRSLQRHTDKKHTPEENKTFQCSVCSKIFARQTFLNAHERYHNPKWHCEICDKRFVCESYLTQHHKLIHTKELSYVCHVCARTFHNYSTYRSHLETHDTSIKKKPHKPRVQCPLCDAWTLKLSHHMRLHSGTKTCEICGEECKNKVTYRYHMKNHKTGDFICTVCDKSFKREIGLKEHMASHTGDVLYSCDFCDRTFNSNANRASHRKKMHPQQWLEEKLKKEAARMGTSSETVPA
nr:transcription factor grauzone-like [Aedes albopictus]